VELVYSRAILFSLAVCWGYMAALLFHQDRRWHAGRIALCVGQAVLPLACLARGGLGPAGPMPAWGALSVETVLSLCLLFVVFGLTPPVLERRLLSGIVRDGAMDRRLLWAYRLLSWSRSVRGLRALEAAASTAEMGLSERARRALLEAFSGRCGPRVRSRYLVQLLYRLIRWDRWSDAVEVFESFFPDPQEAEPEVLFAMVRPYAELGRTERAYACLAAAEAKGPLFRHQQIERLLAYVALFSLTGRRRELDKILSRHQPLLKDFPEAFVPYWRAVADVARGRLDAARRGFSRSADLRSARPEEHLWRSAAARRLDDSVGLQERVRIRPLTDAQADHLLVLDTLALRTARLRPAEARLFGGRMGPVTAGLVALNVLVWVLMGTGSDQAVLVRFGANVPFMVRAGQYWRLISSLFVHIGFLHLLFNCAACYLIGSFIERRSGHRSVFIIYMLSGLAGSLASAFLGEHLASAGASGAIMGLMGAAIAVIVRRRRRLPRAVRNVYPVLFASLVVLTLLFDMLEESIDHLAHIGGFLAGVLVAWLLPFSLPSSERADRERERERVDLRRPREYLTNVLAAFMVVVFLYGGMMATANVLAGGYPAVMPKTVERRSEIFPLAVEAPPFWEQAPGSGPVVLVLRDPLEALFLVRLEPIPPWAARREATARVWEGDPAREVAWARARRAGAALMTMDLGGHRFHHYGVLWDAADERAGEVLLRAAPWLADTPQSVAHLDSLRAAARAEGPTGERLYVRDVYVTPLAGRLCILEFWCEEARRASYLRLVRSVVGSLHLAGEPPAGEDAPSWQAANAR